MSASAACICLSSSYASPVGWPWAERLLSNLFCSIYRRSPVEEAQLFS
jgi:hypothetical protein